MADQKLTDRQSLGTSSSDSSIHVVQGGTSYKQTKGNFLKEINNRIDENQYSGVIVYQTLAELPVTGVINTSYKVANDTSASNNGYYSWNGGTYIKDASLANGVIEIGDTESVSGETTYNFSKAIRTVTVLYDNSTDYININGVDGLIEFPSTFYINGIIDGFGTAKVISSQADLSFNTGDYINLLYFDMVTKTLGIARNSSADVYDDPEKTILISFNAGAGAVTTNGFKVKLNGKLEQINENVLLDKNDVSLLYDTDGELINFNFTDNVIEFPSIFWVMGSNSLINATKYFSGLADLPFAVLSYSINVLLYNTSTNAISVEGISGSPTWQTDINNQIIATFIPQRKTVTTNGWEFTKDGINNEGEFDEDLQRMVLPDKIYISDTPLRLYKNNITATKELRDNNNIYITANEDIREVKNDLLLDNTLSSSVNISQVPVNRNGYIYGKNIDIIVTDASTKSGTKTFIALGDSLTARGVSGYTKAEIENISDCVVTNAGIMTDNTGALGEGRGGWEFENYIGKDNTFDGEVPITRQTTAGTGSTTKNPFLKLASGTDTITNPDWCFTNTGSNLETSYAENSGLGNYYIFDWDFYFTTQGITAPDFLNIGLSTNDIVKTTDWLANSRLGLEIMLKQLDTYCVDNSINIDVSVVPTVTWADVSSNSDRWKKAMEWAENMLTDINSYTFTNITVEAVYIHLFQNDNVTFEGGGSEIGNINAVSEVKKIQYSDIYHPDTDGIKQYAKALAAFFISKY